MRIRYYLLAAAIAAAPLAWATYKRWIPLHTRAGRLVFAMLAAGVFLILTWPPYPVLDAEGYVPVVTPLLGLGIVAVFAWPFVWYGRDGPS